MDWFKSLKFLAGIAKAVPTVIAPPVPYVIAVAFALGLALGGFSTWRVMSWREGAAVTHAAVEALDTAKEQSAATAAIGQKASEDRAKVRATTRIIKERIPADVTREDDSRCVIPDSAVRLLDAAAAGERPVPGPTGRSDGGAATAQPAPR